MKNVKLSLLLLALSPFFCFSQSDLAKEDADEYMAQLMILQGIQAPNFAILDTSGKTVRLQEFKNKLVILDFWFTSCAPCINEIPAFKNLQSVYKNSNNVVFISICMDNIEKKSHWKSLITKHKIPGIHLFMPTNKEGNRENNFYINKINIFPTQLLISKNGLVLGGLPDIETIPVLYSIDSGLKGRTTAESFNDIIKSPEKFIKWANLNKNIITKFQKN